MRGISFSSSTRFEKYSLTPSSSSNTNTNTTNNTLVNHHHHHHQQHHNNNSLSSNNSNNTASSSCASSTSTTATTTTTTTTSASSSSTALHQHFPHPNPNHPSHSSSSATLAKHSLTAAKMMKKLSTTFRRKTALNNGGNNHNHNNHYVSHPYVSHPQQHQHHQHQQHNQFDNVNFMSPTVSTTATTTTNTTTPVVTVSSSSTTGNANNSSTTTKTKTVAGSHRRPTAARAMTFSTPGPTYDAFTAGGLGIGNMSVHDYDLHHQHQLYPNNNNYQRPHSHHADNTSTDNAAAQAEDKLDIPFFGADRDRDRDHAVCNNRIRDRRTPVAKQTGTGGMPQPTVVVRGTPAQLGVIPVGRSVSANTAMPSSTTVTNTVDGPLPSHYLPSTPLTPSTTSTTTTITCTGTVSPSLPLAKTHTESVTVAAGKGEKPQMNKSSAGSSTGSVGSTMSVPLSATTGSSAMSPPNRSPASMSIPIDQNKENECKHAGDVMDVTTAGGATSTKKSKDAKDVSQQQQGTMSPTLQSTSVSETKQDRFKVLHDGRVKMDFSNTTCTKTGNTDTGLVHHDDVDVISSMSDGRLSTPTSAARISASSPCPEHNLKKSTRPGIAKSGNTAGGNNNNNDDQALTQRMQGVLKDSTTATHGRMNLLNTSNNINSLGHRIRQGVGRPPAMPRYRHLSFDAPSLLRKGGSGHRLRDDDDSGHDDDDDDSEDDMPKSLGSPMRLNRYSNGHQHHLLMHHNNHQNHNNHHHALRRHGNVNHHHNSRRMQQQQQEQQTISNSNNTGNISNSNTKFAGRRWLLPLSESPQRPRLFTPADTAIARMNARDRAEAVTLTSACTFLEAEIDRMQAHVRNHHRKTTSGNNNSNSNSNSNSNNTCGKCVTDVYLGKAVDRLRAVLRMLEDRYDSVETVYVKEQEWSNAMTKYLHTSPGEMRHMLSTLSAGTDGSSGDDTGTPSGHGTITKDRVVEEQVDKQKQQRSDGNGEQQEKQQQKCSGNGGGIGTKNKKGSGGGAKKQGVAGTTGNLMLHKHDQQEDQQGKKTMMKRDNAKSFR